MFKRDLIQSNELSSRRETLATRGHLTPPSGWFWDAQDPSGPWTAPQVTAGSALTPDPGLLLPSSLHWAQPKAHPPSFPGSCACSRPALWPPPSGQGPLAPPPTAPSQSLSHSDWGPGTWPPSGPPAWGWSGSRPLSLQPLLGSVILTFSPEADLAPRGAESCCQHQPSAALGPFWASDLRFPGNGDAEPLPGPVGRPVRCQGAGDTGRAVREQPLSVLCARPRQGPL